jgi:dipeptidyl aminopeptidase/acylaminoacyl peptidase
MNRAEQKVSAIIVTLAVTSTFASAQATGKRPIIVKDLIETAEFTGGYGNYVATAFSKDKSRFVFAVQRANLEKNTLVGSILLFRSRDALNHPKPDTIATFVSTGNEPAVAEMQWLGDTAILVRGERPHTPTQLYIVNVATRKVRAITKSPMPIRSFGVTPDQKSIVYVANAVIDSAEYWRREGKGFVVTQTLGELIDGHWTAPAENQQQQVATLVSLATERTQRVTGESFANCYNAPQVTQTGRFIVFTCYYYELFPAGMEYWKAYSDEIGGLAALEILVDPASGLAFRMFDAPSFRQIVDWSPDDKQVVITNALVPASMLTPEERAQQALPRGAFVVDLITRKPALLARRDSLRFVRWESSNGVVLRSLAADSQELIYRHTGNDWKLVDTKKAEGNAPPPSRRPYRAAQKVGDLEIVMEQDLNTPRRVMAVRGEKRELLFDPNPQYAKLAFARTDVFKWRSQDGEWEGGLYYPLGYTPGKRYPLVVQTHGFDKSTFEIEGYNSHNAYAAQVLAGRGVVVLQFGMPLGGFGGMTGNQKEVRTDANGIIAAIDSLVAQGIVDRDKVALQGWSRSTWPVRYILAFTSTPIVAAVISDGVDYSYGQYILHNTVGKQNYEKTNDGIIPVGDGLKSWQDLTPTLRADKITAAVRSEAIDIDYSPMTGPMFMWELHTLLKRLGKPAEMVYFPNSAHDIVRPQQRMTSQDGAVDWFLFWLTGEEDPNPTKTDQYKRWREMKKGAAKVTSK